MRNFETYVLLEAARLRRVFAERNESYLSFTVTVEGPIDHDDLNIVFNIGSSRYSDGNVTGDKIDACCEEFFRRKGWKARNDSLKLSYMTDVRSDD